jgi:hypothetical protein
MAHFTMLLKDVIETVCNENEDADTWAQPYNHFTYDGITYGKLPYIEDYSKIGLGTYPIFDEQYRPILNGKIIDEYFNQEIGTESIDNFMLIMRKKMDQIMPYFNQLYAKIDYSPLMTMNIHSQGNVNINGSEEVTAANNSTSNTKNTGRAVNSDTPQTMLSGDEDYAASAVDSNSSADVTANVGSTSNSSNTAENQSDNLVTGFQGNASRLVMEYRASLINVDMQVISAISDCFMMVLNSGDDYFAYENGWYH